MHGVLIIDKPVGPTSHDVVARLRKVLGTRAVGHSGTLDPAASGVLVVAIGHGTKLVPYLIGHDKAYEATVALGTSTTTLDREGDVVASGPVSSELAEELDSVACQAGGREGPNIRPLLEKALDVERRRTEQVPPVYSAIKQGGRAVHKLARRGEVVVLPPRPVEVRRLAIVGAGPDSLQLSLEVSKGYYVRSLARDLGESLEVPSHLSALRRVASGPFSLREALPLSSPGETLVAAVQTVADTVRRVLPTAILTEEGARRARFGQVLQPPHFDEGMAPLGTSAWFNRAGELVAIGRATEEGGFAVERGFAHSISSDAT